MRQINSQADRSYLDFRALRSQVSIIEVLALVDWQPVSEQGAQLRGPCPIHKSKQPTSRSFSVNREKNVYHCFGCGSEGNQLDLATALFGKEVYGAAQELCQRMGIEPPTQARCHR